jgi:hypothetical protein
LEATLALCKQGVGGSSPPTSTRTLLAFFCNLRCNFIRFSWNIWNNSGRKYSVFAVAGWLFRQVETVLRPLSLGEAHFNFLVEVQVKLRHHLYIGGPVVFRLGCGLMP